MKAPIQSRCFDISGMYLNFAEGDWALGIGASLLFMCIFEQPQPLQPNRFKKGNPDYTL